MSNVYEHPTANKSKWRSFLNFCTQDPEIILTGVFVVAVLTFSWPLQEYKCYSYSKMSNLETDYKVLDGCYVKTDKGWFLKEQLRDIPVNN